MREVPKGQQAAFGEITRHGAVAAMSPKLWVPKVGRTILADLPSERLLAQVAKVLNPDCVIVELTSQPLMSGKSHHYNKGEFVPLERKVTTLGETIWASFIPLPAPPPEEVMPTNSRRKRNRGSRKNAAPPG